MAGRQFVRGVMWGCGLMVAACLSGPPAVAADEAVVGEPRWYGELDATDRRFRFVI